MQYHQNKPLHHEGRDQPANHPGFGGATILMGSGLYFDYATPEVSPITIEDIAWGLASTGRFAGQCWSPILKRRVFYSVAEHCVRMSMVVPRAFALDALMHELGEAPCGDLTSPLKRLCPDFKTIEKRCARAIETRFGVTMTDPALIKHYDLRMLATERRDLMRWGGEAWEILDGVEPLDMIILPAGPEAAAEAFLARYKEIA